MVATGDDFRTVKLFRYPCPVDEAAGQKYSGHSEHVTNIAFSRNESGQQYLISTGGEDKTIFQWKYFMDANAAAESQEVAEAGDEDTFNENGAEEDDDLYESLDGMEIPSSNDTRYLITKPIILNLDSQSSR